MPDAPLTIDVIDDVFVVAGEIDAHTCGWLDEALGDDPKGDVCRVDLRAVTFMDSSGLRVLVRHHQRCTKADVRFEILQPSRPVQRLFEISGLTGQLRIVALES